MKIAFLFYEGMTALDAIGPHEIFSRLPEASVFRVAKHKGPIKTDSIDMALVLSAKIAGEKFAQAIQLGIEYDPDPPFDVGSPEKANPAIREGLRSRMTANFEASA